MHKHGHTFYKAPIALGVLFSSFYLHSADFNEKSISQLHALVEGNQASYQEINQFYLDAIAKNNKQGFNLNAVISINPHTLEQAKQKDLLRNQGQVVGPLFGMPIIVKDNINTLDGMATTAGALALANNYSQNDAFLVEKLKQAGAIIIGKANLSEWANFRSSISSSGWSDVGGQAKNPYVLNRTPCGSSSGSAVAVAANFAVAAIGTETDGSITCPASHTSLVGIKPSVGLISRSGVVPLSASQDSPGPMTRTVADAALLLTVLAQPDPKEATFATHPGYIDYRQFLKQDGLKGKRIGIARNISDFNAVSTAAFNQALSVLKAQGAIIIDDLELPDQESLSQAEFDVLLYDFKHDLNQYLSQTPKEVSIKTLEQLIQFNQSNTDLTRFNQALLTMANEKTDLTSPNYQQAQTLIELKGRKNGIDALMQAHQLDAIAAPTNSPAWVIDTINGDHFAGASSAPSAIAGYPLVTVPMSYHHELPLGISFFGTRLSEGKLIEIAYGFEQANPIRQAAKFIPTID